MSDPNQPERHRLRLVFAKTRDIKYISHLDLALAWERALRRAELPLQYSQGFNPRPKMQFASSLPLGSTSTCEVLDIYVAEPLEPAAVLVQVRPKLPMGIRLHSVEVVPARAPALQELLRQADYRVTVETDIPEAALRTRVAALLAEERIIETRERRKRTERIDIRPMIHELKLGSITNGDAHFFMRLDTGQRGNLRPESVLKALDLADTWAEIERTRLLFRDKRGAYFEVTAEITAEPKADQAGG